jgi:NAD(P)-dependent dehydrogenase (short-subunit alcohol dehydrogenase family)
MTVTLITGADNGLGRTTIIDLLQQIVASGSEPRDG